MFVLRRSLLGAGGLARTLGIWPAVLLLLWAPLIKLQEPDFFRWQHVPFFWASTQAILLLMIGLLPLAYRMSQGIGAANWVIRTARSPLGEVVSTWLAVVWYGLVVVMTGVLISYTVERILGVPSPLSAPSSVIATTLGFLSITAALAPVLALLSWATPTLVAGWLVVAAAALHFFGPTAGGLQISATPVESLSISGIVPTGLATVGGLAVSLAHRYHRLRS